MVALADVRNALEERLGTVMEPYKVPVTGPSPIYSDGADKGSFRSFCFVTLLEVKAESGSKFTGGGINATAIYGIAIGFNDLPKLEEIFELVLRSMVGFLPTGAARMVGGPEARFLGIDSSRKVWSYSIAVPVPILLPPQPPPPEPTATVEVWQSIEPRLNQLDPATTDPNLSPGGDSRILIVEAQSQEPEADDN